MLAENHIYSEEYVIVTHFLEIWQVYQEIRFFQKIGFLNSFRQNDYLGQNISTILIGTIPSQYSDQVHILAIYQFSEFLKLNIGIRWRIGCKQYHAAIFEVFDSE